MSYIIRFRYIIFAFFTLLLIIFAFLINKVNLNYDATLYLPENIKTSKALHVLDEEFGINGNCEIMVENISVNESLIIYQQLQSISNIKYIEYFPDNDDFYNNNHALYKITFQEGNYHENTKLAIKNIEHLLSDYQIHIIGESIVANKFSEVVQSEIITIILIIIPIVLLILILTTSSWIEPLIFIIVTVIAVFINMGSNIMFPHISYITHTTSGILLLALCMDYSVIYLHSYRKYRISMPSYEALQKAFKSSFVPILSSSLTTIGGFTALILMQYKIGFDIGIVLGKGTLISLIVTFVLLPGLIYIFDPLITKTTHKSFLKTPKFIKTFILKTKLIMPIFGLILILLGFFIHNQNEFAYSERLVANESKTLQQSNLIIKENFGENNYFMILLPINQIEKEGLLINEIILLTNEQNISLKSINSIFYLNQKIDKNSFQELLISYHVESESVDNLLLFFDILSFEQQQSKFSILEILSFIEINPNIPIEEKLKLISFNEIIQQSLLTLTSENYHRVIFNINLEIESQRTFKFIEMLDQSIINLEIKDYYLIGESPAIYDIKHLVDNDRNQTSILTIIIVFLIILITSKSILIPIILVLLIQGAIWINMSFPVILNHQLLIIGFIIVSSIQLASTIDYGILYTSRFIDLYKTNNKTDAILIAFDEAKNTVLTSGLILIGAGFTLSFVSSIPSISVFGSLIGRGGIISTIFVLFILPQTYHLLYKKNIFNKFY